MMRAYWKADLSNTERENFPSKLCVFVRLEGFRLTSEFTQPTVRPPLLCQKARPSRFHAIQIRIEKSVLILFSSDQVSTELKKSDDAGDILLHQ